MLYLMALAPVVIWLIAINEMRRTWRPRGPRQPDFPPPIRWDDPWTRIWVQK